MRISIYAHTIIKFDIHHDSKSELHQIEEFYFLVLAKVFLNKPALMITIAPQRYSIGYEIDSFQEMKIEKSKFLINEIQICSSSILTGISRAEEFSRGLLFLMAYTKDSTENIENVLKHIDNNIGIENLSIETIVCENDGNSLCLYNTKIDFDELKVSVLAESP